MRPFPLPCSNGRQERRRSATGGLLVSTASVTAIHGSAGTAKTTTVLATYARTDRDEGLVVRDLAPTATAADVLGRTVNAEPMTVARMLNGGEEIEQGREAWIVDEASMLSARDAARLLALAREAGARLGTYLINNGLLPWLPPQYKTVFHMPVNGSIHYGFIMSGAALIAAFACALAIDKVGRRRWYVGALLFAPLPLAALYWQGATSAMAVLCLATPAFAAMQTVTYSLYLFRVIWAGRV
ncbi:AAA family ATPase [Novosphingobium rosa]|uniref:AAA family ATPase n=1 Tax=Novosphingobium rosa TaxID=76978 RepID=UPI00082AB7EE|nr:AAA family ATPase [Novosphingobium rosa]